MSRLSTSESLSIAAILGLAAWLRLTGIAAGIPWDLASDEPHVMERAVRILRTGDFNPHFFDYPGFYIYLQAAVAGLRFLAGAMEGTWRSLDQAATADFYLTARVVTVTFGLATVAVVWRVGRRIDRLAGLAASFLLAVQPLHARESHFVLTDVPMTFFVVLALLATVRAVEAGTMARWLLAGATVGLAAGTKYTGGVAIVIPLSTLMLMPAAWRVALPRAAVVCAGVAGAFLVVAPYTVLDPPGFLNGFAALASAHAHGPEPVAPAWRTYLRHLEINHGLAGAILLAASLPMAAVRMVRSRAPEARVIWGAGLAFSLTFYWVIAGQTLVFARYLLPLLPVLFVLAGATGVAGYRWLARGRGWRWRGHALAGAALVLAVGAQPAMRAHAWAVDRARPTTQGLAYAWIVQHVPAGSHLAIESTMSLPAAWTTRHVRFLGDEPREYYDAIGVEYFVVSREPIERDGVWRAPGGRPYPDLLRDAVLVAAFMPDGVRRGPAIEIYQRVVF